VYRREDVVFQKIASLACVALLGAAPAFGATFAVTRFDDGSDGACDADCTLREAVIAANASPGADTVTLPAGAYDLDVTDATAGVDEDLAATGDLDVAGGGLTLEGAGAATTEIDATLLGNRIFHVQRAFSSAAITFRGVTLERGDASSLGSSGGGSAIRIDDSFTGLVVTLDDVVIDKNVGTSAVLTVTTLHVTDCTFSENAVGTALELRTAGQNKSTTAATRIQGTTFRENDGFAITAVKNENRVHQFELFNSTFSGNNATGASGIDAAIFTTNSAKIWNATIADDGGYGIGALTDAYGTPLVQLQGNILRGNAFGNVMPTSATDGAVLPVSSGGNVVSDSGAGLFTQPNDKVGTNPLLLPLADNGGKTLTYDLDPASPAIDAVTTLVIASCPATDQRGEARPQDGNGDMLPVCDAGAVEVPEPSAMAVGCVALVALGLRSRRR
jgi:CSLREA domain-containing protein